MKTLGHYPSELTVIRLNQGPALIVAGTRTVNITPGQLGELIADKMEAGLIPETVEAIVSGGAKGVDTTAEKFAKSRNIPFFKFLPDWEKSGRAAGPARNRKMAQNADFLLLIWDGKSKGSLSMKTEMQKLGKPVVEVLVDANGGLVK